MSGLSRVANRLITKHLMMRFSSKYKLNHRGRGAINYIDVGSVGGLPDPWRANADLVRFVLNFEPNVEASRQANSLTYNTAVWEIDAVLPFYVYKGFENTGSSLFEQNLEYVKANFEQLKLRGPSMLADTWFDRSTLIKTVELKCRKLDGILAEELPNTPFHFMKIDAQGAEYNILKGSETLLSGSCMGLHLELFTLPLYKGAMLLDEVEKFLSGFGFRLVKRFPAHGSFDSQHDCLFVKEFADPALLTLVKKVYGV